MSSQGPQKTPKQSYITSDNFGPFFFKYTQTLVNGSYRGAYTGTYVGTLTPVTSDSTKTPAGRILHETGKKLFPGANPGVSNYMISVYDSVSLLTGFIDPNARVFQIYNISKPNFFPTDSNNTVNAFGGAYGPSIVTGGNILQITQDISGNITPSFTGIIDNLSSYTQYASFYQYNADSNMYIEAFDASKNTCAYIGSKGYVAATNGIGYSLRTVDKQEGNVFQSVRSVSNAPTGNITLSEIPTPIGGYSTIVFKYINSTIGANDYMSIQYNSGLPNPAFFSYAANCSTASTANITIMNHTPTDTVINSAVLQFVLMRYISSSC